MTDLVPLNGAIAHIDNSGLPDSSKWSVLMAVMNGTPVPVNGKVLSIHGQVTVTAPVTQYALRPV